MGLHIHSRIKRGGDRKARRQRQRVNRGRSRDDRVVSGALARALNPFQGGSVPRNTGTPSKLQLLQRFTVAGSDKREFNPVRQGPSDLCWDISPN